VARKTTEEFIEDAINIHGNTYSYSLVDYKNNYTKVKIICSKHGEFEQRPKDHLKKNRCPKCYGNKKKTTEIFIEDAINIHGNKYDYNLVDYKNNHTKVIINCRKHGRFEQKPNDHLSNRGCPKCYGTSKKTTEEFIEDAIDVHGNTYDYSLVDYNNAQAKVIINCRKHGKFEQKPYSHLNGHGCPNCFNSSRGEQRIKKMLIENETLFEQQKTFPKCKNLRLLYFDFYLPDYNLCIEYDGKQHYKPTKFFGGIEEFKKVRKRDEIKTIYCKNNGIKLLRIKYNEDIKEKLEEIKWQRKY